MGYVYPDGPHRPELRPMHALMELKAGDLASVSSSGLHHRQEILAMCALMAAIGRKCGLSEL